jgi:chromosome segregation ATPase
LLSHPWFYELSRLEDLEHKYAKSQEERMRMENLLRFQYQRIDELFETLQAKDNELQSLKATQEKLNTELQNLKATQEKLITELLSQQEIVHLLQKDNTTLATENLLHNGEIPDFQESSYPVPAPAPSSS